jgi:hypothetical protein
MMMMMMMMMMMIIIIIITVLIIIIAIVITLWHLFHGRTIPTERPPLVCEVSANFSG